LLVHEAFRLPRGNGWPDRGVGSVDRGDGWPGLVARPSGASAADGRKYRHLVAVA
jgi:hypothetical protein